MMRFDRFSIIAITCSHTFLLPPAWFTGHTGFRRVFEIDRVKPAPFVDSTTSSGNVEQWRVALILHRQS